MSKYGRFERFAEKHFNTSLWSLLPKDIKNHILGFLDLEKIITTSRDFARVYFEKLTLQEKFSAFSKYFKTRKYTYGSGECDYLVLYEAFKSFTPNMLEEMEQRQKITKKYIGFGCDQYIIENNQFDGYPVYKIFYLTLQFLLRHNQERIFLLMSVLLPKMYVESLGYNSSYLIYDILKTDIDWKYVMFLFENLGRDFSKVLEHTSINFLFQGFFTHNCSRDHLPIFGEVDLLSKFIEMLRLNKLTRTDSLYILKNLSEHAGIVYDFDAFCEICQASKIENIIEKIESEEILNAVKCITPLSLEKKLELFNVLKKSPDLLGDGFFDDCIPYITDTKCLCFLMICQKIPFELSPFLELDSDYDDTYLREVCKIVSEIDDMIKLLTKFPKNSGIFLKAIYQKYGPDGINKTFRTFFDSDKSHFGLVLEKAGQSTYHDDIILDSDIIEYVSANLTSRLFSGWWPYVNRSLYIYIYKNTEKEDLAKVLFKHDSGLIRYILTSDNENDIDKLFIFHRTSPETLQEEIAQLED